MARRRTKSRRRKTGGSLRRRVSANTRRIRKVDLRDRPPLKAVLEPARQNLLLDFTDTVWYQKTFLDEIAGDLYHYTRIRPSTNKDQANMLETYGGRNDVGLDATRLECHRPLIYEPRVWKQAMLTDDFGIQGNRKARRVPSTIVSGSFRIRMTEGKNNVEGWVGGTQLRYGSDGMGMPDEGLENDTYTKDGFGSTQYVRVIGMIVNDMGDGYSNFQGKPITDNVQANQPQSNYYTKNFGDGTIFEDAQEHLDKRHLLAPAMADIFEGYWQDPAGDMIHDKNDLTAEGDKWYRHEELMTLKYKKNTPSGTPNALSLVTEDTAQDFTHDPLRGDKRSRNFHIFHDKVIAFVPRGTTESTYNQTGARQHDMKWSIRITNQRFMQDIRETEDVMFANADHTHEYNPTGVIDPSETTGVFNTGSGGITTYSHTLDKAVRTVEGCNKRIMWYFMPSLSTHVNGYYRGSQVAGTGQPSLDDIGEFIHPSALHHHFEVTTGPEKCFFVEKDDE